MSKEKSIEIFMKRLHIDVNMKTNSDKFKSSLADMYLDDFKHSESIFEDYLYRSVNLSELFLDIKKGIIDNHPALLRVLDEALESNLIPDTLELLPQIETSIYNIIILEKITQRMYDELSFCNEIREHFISKREKALGQKRNTLRYFLGMKKSLGGLFEILKTLTMDYTFNQYIEFREKKVLDKNDLFKKRLGLSANILEAFFKDFFQGAFHSSSVAWKLLTNPMKDIYLVGEKKQLKQIFKDKWTNLYETWNLAFVTRNLNYLNFLYAKLLIPRMVNAKEEDYLMNRGLSLWIIINVYFFKKLNKEEDDSVLTNAKKISDLWAKINFDYAKENKF